MSLFYDSSKPIKLSFIVLSLWTNEKHFNVPKARELLIKPFLNRLQEKTAMTTYIVKEHFDHKKRIHFHVTTTTLIPEAMVATHWTELLLFNGVITKWIDTHAGKIPITSSVEYSN